MVNLALSNGQVVTTSLANMQTMAQTNVLNQSSSAGNLVFLLQTDTAKIVYNNLVFF